MHMNITTRSEVVGKPLPALFYVPQSWEPHGSTEPFRTCPASRPSHSAGPQVSCYTKIRSLTVLVITSSAFRDCVTEL